MVFRLPDQGGHVLIVHRVVDGGARALGLYHPPIAQQTELVGDGRLRNAGDDGQVPNAERSRAESIEEARSRRIGVGT